MCKSCKNCFWESEIEGHVWCAFQEQKPLENYCNKYDCKCEGCSVDIATLEHEGKKLCYDCLVHELELDTYTETHFYTGGVYLGTDEDMKEVYNNLNKIGIMVKEIEEE